MAQLTKPMRFFDEDEVPSKRKLKKPMIFRDDTKDFEKKKYIILYILLDEDEYSCNRFKVCTGRTETYSFIREILEEFDSIDIMESLIITETKQIDINTNEEAYFMLNLDNAISIYRFCKHVEEYYNDGFDIEEYNYSRFDSDEKEITILNQEALDIYKNANINIFNNESTYDNSDNDEENYI